MRQYTGRACHRYKYADCVSTNELALKLLAGQDSGDLIDDLSKSGGSLPVSLQHGKQPDALIVRADYQTAGRGTHGRVWYGETRQNLYLSIALKQPTWTTHFTDYQYLSCLAVLFALRKLDAALDLTLKYPNDLLLRSNSSPKKLSGILVETEFRSMDLQACVCGIGVNVNQRTFDQDHGPNAVSLSDALHKQLDIDAIENAICNEFFSLMDRSPDEIFEWWKEEVLCQKLVYHHTVSNKDFYMHSIDRNGRAVLNSADKTQLISVDSLREFQIRHV